MPQLKKKTEKILFGGIQPPTHNPLNFLSPAADRQKLSDAHLTPGTLEGGQVACAYSLLLVSLGSLNC